MYEKLDKSFMNMVKILASIVILKEGANSLHLPNMSRLAKAIAQNMEFSESEIRDMEIASFLCDIGKIGITDTILNKAYAVMTTSEKMAYMKHPILGQAMLKSIENMQNVSAIIRHHHERWDGKGYPDGIGGEEIPIGSRILSILSDYRELMNGVFMCAKFKKNEAKQFIKENSGQRYDPRIVALFVSNLESLDKKEDDN